MAEIIKGEGIKRTHIKSNLMRESLVDKKLQLSTETKEEVKIFPDLNIIKIGGQSIIDKGKVAVFPLLEEIVQAHKTQQILIGVGGGVRERHTYEIGLDLGLPIGGLAMLGGAIPEQNALMLQVLLAKHNGKRIPKDHFEELPMYLKVGTIPIIVGMPPYHYWEHIPVKGRLPSHGGDTGMYLISEVFSAKTMIFVKDVDGLYTDDPNKNPNAEFIPKISVQELIKLNLPDLPIERIILDIMLNARNSKKIHIINGLKKGNLLKAINGEEVGTIIYKEE